jgi:sugar lactone lactonase YvrE
MVSAPWLCRLLSANVSRSADPREPLLTAEQGYPDGMCLDAEEHLWIAMWGLGRVHRYSPTGELVSVIVLAPDVSSVAFAAQGSTPWCHHGHPGPHRRTLARFPDSGRPFTTVPGVTGLPQAVWSGSLGPALSPRTKD